MKKGDIVIVVTSHRSTWCGTLVEADLAAGTATVTNCRMALVWGLTAGLGALATEGPGESARIGPVTPEVTMGNVCEVAVVTAEASEVWHKFPVCD